MWVAGNSWICKKKNWWYVKLSRQSFSNDYYDQQEKRVRILVKGINQLKELGYFLQLIDNLRIFVDLTQP